MTHKTILLDVKRVAEIQSVAEDFNCTILNIFPVSSNSVRVCVCGYDQDMKSLFESIGLE